MNLEQKLKNNEKYIIKGNNVSFIFSNSEIEKKELYHNYNGSSIILNECENILKLKYLIPFENTIPLMKIEKYNFTSSNIDVYFELFNTFNFTQKLDLNLCSNNYIEIRLPLVLKQYKLDLVLKAVNFGYNIFDLNDSFYHDICSVFTFNNSDYSLSERKSLLDLSDENIDIPNCNFSNFDIKTIRIIYLCKFESDLNNNKSLDKNISNYNGYNTDNDIFDFDFLKKNILF